MQNHEHSSSAHYYFKIDAFYKLCQKNHKFTKLFQILAIKIFNPVTYPFQRICSKMYEKIVKMIETISNLYWEFPAKNKYWFW